MRGYFSRLALIVSTFFTINSALANSHEEEEVHEDEMAEYQSAEDVGSRLGSLNFVDPSKVFIMPKINLTQDELESIRQDMRLARYWDESSENEEEPYEPEIRYTELELQAIRENDPDNGMRDLVFKELQRYGKKALLPEAKEWAHEGWPELYENVDGIGNSLEDLRDKTLLVQEEGKEVNDEGEEVVARRFRAYVTLRDDGTVGRVTYRNFDHIDVDGRVRWDGRFTADVEYRGEVLGFTPDIELDVEPLTGEYGGMLMMSKPLEGTFDFFPKFWGKKD
tara:strand:- start:5691 stop:6530 length:840 start_codon:yes stop_codon:yes gene_type:complete